MRVWRGSSHFRFFLNFFFLKLVSSSSSGQPGLIQQTLGVKYVMYTASTPNGLHLPPVIFTSDYLPDFDDPKSRYTDKDGNAAYLHYIPNISSPNSQTTIMWLHDMRDERAPMLENGCTLLLDQAGWHKKEEVMQEFEDAEIEVILLPAKTGKWLDPQDQSFHRELRRKFVALMAQRGGLKLDKILQAYWTMHDKVVTSSWRQTGLLK